MVERRYKKLDLGIKKYKEKMDNMESRFNQIKAKKEQTTFCCFCLKYVKECHFCRMINEFVKVDKTNLMIIRAPTEIDIKEDTHTSISSYKDYFTMKQGMLAERAKIIKEEAEEQIKRSRNKWS